MHILIIDDDVAVGTLFKKFFQSVPCEINIATSGKQAMGFLQMKPYDMVFLDMMMPVQDGLDTYRQIRKAFPTLSIMIMTGYADNERIGQAIQEGALGCLVKPFGLHEIRKMMAGRSVEGAGLPENSQMPAPE